ncbi:VOC family protein [Pseudaminobacter sp. 19-2017]|uniref:VOC family protein n=1 Tax=Pseudaminobacter soli (ex Zhang et al. 2022) TaxID=2831468 RepID=A0A942I2Q8_9HYPH|nr:VOC family protein [Pseudaminobacter soli]MBS3650072.1 VOC family protein [Pseudaminobacter soli]
MEKIITCLWFDKEAEDAAQYYASVFRNAKVTAVTRAPGGGEPHVTQGAVLTAEFEIEGRAFVALNGGKVDFSFNDSISFQVMCDDQAEVDEYSSKLTADGGREVQCGWLKDKYGVSWQIVPRIFPRLIGDPDPAKAARAMRAMMQMIKLDIATLEEAARG